MFSYMKMILRYLRVIFFLKSGLRTAATLSYGNWRRGLKTRKTLRILLNGGNGGNKHNYNNLDVHEVVADLSSRGIKWFRYDVPLLRDDVFIHVKLQELFSKIMRKETKLVINRVINHLIVIYCQQYSLFYTDKVRDNRYTRIKDALNH